MRAKQAELQEKHKKAQLARNALGAQRDWVHQIGDPLAKKPKVEEKENVLVLVFLYF